MKLNRYHIPLVFLLFAVFFYAFSVFSEGRVSEKSSSVKDAQVLATNIERLLAEASKRSMLVAST